MVEIECPHCDEDIELDDSDFGLFECPHCEEEFEWASESFQGSDLFRQIDFWIGSLTPFLVTFFGLFLSFIFLGDTWDFLGAALICLMLWPIVAIGIGIFGYLNNRMLLWFGAAASLAVWVFLFLVAWLVNP